HSDTEAAGTPALHASRFDVAPSAGFNPENVLGPVDSSTFNADGTITITLSNSKLHQNPDPTQPPNGTPPSAGSLISGIHGETRELVGVLLVLVDTTSSGSYTLSGNAFCAPDTPPTAALQATPSNGSAPLTVSL